MIFSDRYQFIAFAQAGIKTDVDLFAIAMAYFM